MVLKLITLEDDTEYTSVVQIRNSKTKKLLLNCEKLSNTPTRINLIMTTITGDYARCFPCLI